MTNCSHTQFRFRARNSNLCCNRFFYQNEFTQIRSLPFWHVLCYNSLCRCSFHLLCLLMLHKPGNDAEPIGGTCCPPRLHRFCLTGTTDTTLSRVLNRLSNRPDLSPAAGRCFFIRHQTKKSRASPACAKQLTRIRHRYCFSVSATILHDAFWPPPQGDADDQRHPPARHNQRHPGAGPAPG